MDEMSQRITGKSNLVAMYVKSNDPWLYKWGLTDHDLVFNQNQPDSSQ